MRRGQWLLLNRCCTYERLTDYRDIPFRATFGSDALLENTIELEWDFH